MMRAMIYTVLGLAVASVLLSAINGMLRLILWLT